MNKNPIFYLGLVAIFAGLVEGCSQDNKSKKILADNDKKFSHYDSIIYRTVANFPDSAYFLRRDSFCNKEILTVRKEVYEILSSGYPNDNKILEFRLHKFTCNGGQSCPTKIIYLTDHHGFEYAFPFFDCNYCRESDSCDKSLKDIYNLNGHLKNIVLGLKLNKDTLARYGYIRKVITMMAGDLLEMREIHPQDTVLLLGMIKHPLKMVQTGKPEIITQKIKENIEGIIKGVKKDDGLYYFCNEGFGAFWKFSIIKESGNDFIRADFLNREGHIGLYF